MASSSLHLSLSLSLSLSETSLSTCQVVMQLESLRSLRDGPIDTSRWDEQYLDGSNMLLKDSNKQQHKGRRLQRQKLLHARAERNLASGQRKHLNTGAAVTRPPCEFRGRKGRGLGSKVRGEGRG